MIKDIEFSIIERAFGEGWVNSNRPHGRTDKKVAIVGSGPAGLTCADELATAGHDVTVFEREDRIGGLLMYGIPNMKLEKHVVDRRIALLENKGICFRTSTHVGVDITGEELDRTFDAIVLCCGAGQPRDLNMEGRSLAGIYFAMDFLTGNTKRVLGDYNKSYIDVSGQDVIVIGGGDTGTDCVGTALRQGCKSLVQFEIMPKPDCRIADHDAWLSRTRVFNLDYGQEENIALFGDDPRQFSILSRRFAGNDTGQVVGVETVATEFLDGKIREIEGTERFWKADAIFLAMGFTGVEKSNLYEELKVEITDRNTIVVDDQKRTSASKVFAAGDCERGQSLVVWAIADGRKAAREVDDFLKARGSDLPMV
jgi:glutamate synthase (NADPH/NADH) small chain